MNEAVGQCARTGSHREKHRPESEKSAFSEEKTTKKLKKVVVPLGNGVFSISIRSAVSLNNGCGISLNLKKEI